MICDVNKGKITISEALSYDLGLLQYLWYNAMKEAKNKQNQNKKLDDALQDMDL
jgi:DNA-binding protein YbaB